MPPDLSFDSGFQEQLLPTKAVWASSIRSSAAEGLLLAIDQLVAWYAFSEVVSGAAGAQIRLLDRAASRAAGGHTVDVRAVIAAMLDDALGAERANERRESYLG
jgi:hypothetical protein